jgi:hypothetical protein
MLTETPTSAANADSVKASVANVAAIRKFFILNLLLKSIYREQAVSWVETKYSCNHSN